jgi:hypothetical protein
MLARRRPLPRRLAALTAHLFPAAVVTEPLPDGRDVHEPTRAELARDWEDAEVVLEQRLSLDLAHLYRRNVACSRTLEPNLRREQHQPGGPMLTGNGAPKQSYIRTGPYLRMLVSIAMARQMLKRDGGSGVAAAP